MKQGSQRITVRALAVPRRWLASTIAIAAVGAATITAALAVTPDGAAAVAPRAPIPASAVSQLRAVALKFAADNGDSTPQSITAVAATRRQALTVATPGDAVASGAAQTVYLVVMTGHFVGQYLPVPPGVPAPTGSYLSIVVNSRTFLMTDLGLSAHGPPIAVATLGPVTRIMP